MSETTDSTAVLLISADLFLGSRVRGAADSAGHALDVAASGPVAVERLESGQYRLVLIDLETPGLNLAELIGCREAGRPPRFVAYGPHVRIGLLERARSAGCDAVLTRGQFDATIGELLTRSVAE